MVNDGYIISEGACFSHFVLEWRVIFSHAGDLGNIREDRDGRVMTTLFIPDFPDFTGDFSITGRSLIVSTFKIQRRQ